MVPTIFFLNKILIVPVEDVPVFKDPVDKRIEALFKALFSTADPSL